MNKETKLRIRNITAKAALKFGSEAWVLNKREEQRLEAAQMKFLRHLLGITKLDKEKNQFYTHGSVHHDSMLIKVQLDATVCRHLFTATSLYMFRVSRTHHQEY